MTAPVYSRPSPFDDAAGISAPLVPYTGNWQLRRDDTTLSRMAEDLLEVVRSSAVAKGLTLPERQSVYMAPIPADCEQVAVLFSGWTPQPAPDGGTIVCANFRWSAGMSVIITRCTPAVAKNAKTAPTTDQMIAAARIASADAEIMLEVISRLTEVGSDLSITAAPPSGGLQTVELNVVLLSNVGV